MMLIRAFTHILRPTRLRSLAFVVALLAGAGCGNDSDPVATSAPTDLPETLAATDSVTAPDSPMAADSVSLLASLTNTYTGIPFGPFGIWKSYTGFYWGPRPFTNGQACISASGAATLIRSARTYRQRIVLMMTCGAPSNYMTNGRFDLAKWKNKMKTFNTSTIRNAIAAGVADGTIMGNSMIDEPETARWNGSVNKAMLDNAAAFAKSMFPTLPQGVSHGSTGFQWRTSERYYKVDFVQNQYAWWVTKGNIATWRDKVLAQSRHDGVTTAFSVNVLGGGVRDSDNDGKWECPQPLTQGKGTYYPVCRMTASQLRDWSRAVGPYGCFMTLWKYDGTFFARSDNQQAFRDVASTLGAKARRSCRRP